VLYFMMVVENFAPSGIKDGFCGLAQSELASVQVNELNDKPIGKRTVIDHLPQMRANILFGSHTVIKMSPVHRVRCNFITAVTIYCSV
jgi:hypothetical protein